MRRIALVFALGAALAAAAAPAAARERFGVMKSFHGAQRILVLDDGTQYRVAADVAVPLFRSGDRVRFTVEERGGEPVIVRLSVAE